MSKDDRDWLNKELKGEDKIKPTYPNEEIGNESTLNIGEKEIEFLHTPGHTPDSIIGLLRDEKIVIAGDTVMELPFFGYGDSRALVESLKTVQSISRGAKIIQGHGGICDSDKLEDDFSYIADLTRRTTEYLASGRTVEQATSDIKLEDCVSKERLQFLIKGFGSILWCHPENVRTIYAELETRTKQEGTSSRAMI
jgi:glyoxylase-like metal-dependent hydrolase (beta-lactamase superfamily II)